MKKSSSNLKIKNLKPEPRSKNEFGETTKLPSFLSQEFLNMDFASKETKNDCFYSTVKLGASGSILQPSEKNSEVKQGNRLPVIGDHEMIRVSRIVRPQGTMTKFPD